MPVKLSYEDKRLLNIQKNNEILANLGLEATKKVFTESKKRKAVSRSKSRIQLKRKKEPIGPLRRSLRVQGVKIEENMLPDDYKEKTRNIETTLPEIELSLQGNVELEEDGKIYLESLKKRMAGSGDVMIKKESKEFISLAEKYASLDVQEVDALKLTYARAYSLDVSPANNILLFATGDKKGNIGIYSSSLEKKEREKNEPHIFSKRIHSDSISSCYFDRINTAKLLTTSYDGSIKLLDAEKTTFEEILSSGDVGNNLVFDITNYSSTEFGAAGHPCFAALSDGSLLHFDLKRKKPIGKPIIAHEKKINCVEVNRTNENYLVTSSLDRVVKLWDIRNISKGVAVSEVVHPLAVAHADFSPDGKYVVSICNDDYLHVFEAGDGNLGKSMKSQIGSFKHRNQTGRWLTRFKLNFRKDDKSNHFVVGCMDQPRCIEAFSIGSGKQKIERVMRMRSDMVNSVQSLNKFHDTQDIIVSANGSGRVHIWQ
eukprot:maker-scaffold_7-snap-gene-1.1-mRNA-1 protein AED:0.00 eAED:0.00 QI:114/1/1/1/1/1/2/57/484